MSEFKSKYAKDAAIARIVHLERENDELQNEVSELRKDKERLDWLLNEHGVRWDMSSGFITREDIDTEMTESGYKNMEKTLDQAMEKDKERLDWVLSHEGRYWLSSREDIDREMEEAQ